MRMTLRVPPDDENTRFAPGCFDSQIGKTIPVRVGDRSVPGVLVAAEVALDGEYVELTVEVEASPVDLGPLPPMSFGFRP